MVSWVLHLHSVLYSDSWKFLICVFVQLKPCHGLYSLISSCVLRGGRPCTKERKVALLLKILQCCKPQNE